jgi:hypothetical protein
LQTGHRRRRAGEPSRSATFTMRTHSFHPSFLVGFGLVLAVSSVLACSCMPTPPPKEALGKADAVFSGTVTEISPLSREETINGKKYRLPIKRVTFRIIETWKGTNATTQVVYTGKGSGDCGYRFLPGSNYLVYANEITLSLPKESEFKALGTGICSRTCPESEASEDLKVLGKGQKPATK